MKIIHQIWLQGEDNLPKDYRNYLKEYRNMPGYKHMLWDDVSIRKLIKNTFPHLIKVYDYYPFWVMRVDLVKYVILYNYGGFYVDMDTKPLKSFDDLIIQSKGKPIVTYYDIRENPKYKHFSFILSQIMNNQFMYSPHKYHSLYKLLANRSQCTYKRALWDFKVYYILASIGPIYVYDTIQDYGPNKVHHLHIENFKKYVHDYTANSWCDDKAFIDLDTRDKIVLVVFILAVIYTVYALYKSVSLVD